jgi:membrane-associated phospholipid phosphatase
MKKFSILILIIAFNFNHFYAIQSDTLRNDNTISSSIADDAKHLLNTGFSLAKAPFSFSNADWMKTGLITAGTISLFAVDKDLRTIALQNQNSLNDKIFNFDSFHGNAYTALYTASLYGYGLIFKDKEIRRLGLNTFEAFIYSGIITGVLKVAIGRRRPFAGDNHLFLKPLQITNNVYQALPSGHTTVSFAVSTVMAEYIDNIYWKIFWYGAGGMVALSRVYHNKHWASDVFLGGAVGYFVGSFIVNQNNKNSNSLLGSKIKPYLNLNEIGFLYIL